MYQVNFFEYFSSEVLSELRACGWSEDRRVDLEHIRAKFSRHGIHMHSAAELLLLQLDGLTLRSKVDLSSLSFSVDAITEWMISGEAEFYFGLINKELCPIALGSCFLHITDTLEAIFLGDDWGWYTYAPSLNDLLDSFLFSKESRFPTFSIDGDHIPPACRGKPTPPQWHGDCGDDTA